MFYIFYVIGESVFDVYFWTRLEKNEGVKQKIPHEFQRDKIRQIVLSWAWSGASQLRFER